MWKKLDHANIVKFIDFSETPNNIYFFLEYCDSGDLDKYLRNNGKILLNLNQNINLNPKNPVL